MVKASYDLGHNTIRMVFHLLTATIIVCFLTFGSAVESRFNPVLSDFQITDYQVNNQELTIWGYVDKRRPECYPIDISFWENIDGHLSPLTVRFDGDDFHDDRAKDLLLRTRPEGSQKIGPWTIGGYEGTTPIIMKTIHKCHPFWETDGSYEADLVGIAQW